MERPAFSQEVERQKNIGEEHRRKMEEFKDVPKIARGLGMVGAGGGVEKMAMEMSADQAERVPAEIFKQAA